MPRCTIATRRAGGRVARLEFVAALFVAALVAGAGPSARAIGTPTADPAVTPTAGGALVVAGDRLAALVPAQPATPVVYAIDGGGLYRLEAGGDDWERAGALPPAAVVVAGEDDPRLLLAGDRPACARGGAGEPLRRSRDGGATWETLAGGTGIRPLAAWAEPPLALGADCAGLRFSTDSGETWRPAPGPGSGFIPSALAPFSAERPAGRAALVVGTSDRGASRLWRLDLADPDDPRASEALVEFWGSGAVAGAGNRYAVGTAQGVLVSADGGATWRLQRRGLEEVTLSVDPFRGPIPEEELRRGFGIEAVAVDPADPARHYAGTVGGLYASHDGGEHWRRVPGAEGNVTALVLRPDSGQILAETPAGVVVVSTGT